MDIFFGLVAGIAVAFALFNKTIDIRVTHKTEYPPMVEEDKNTNDEDLADVEKELRKAYGSILEDFMGVEVMDNGKGR
jgi:hypothetical protein